MFAICDEFGFYGYRRVGAAVRQYGLVMYRKKIRRLMRQHNLHPKIRRRFVATTDSNHDGPIFPSLPKDIVPTGNNQLWFCDITYVALLTRSVYVAVILDAWSLSIDVYALSRSIDARMTVAALKAAIERCRAPSGCLHHSDVYPQGRTPGHARWICHNDRHPGQARGVDALGSVGASRRTSHCGYLLCSVSRQ